MGMTLMYKGGWWRVSTLEGMDFRAMIGADLSMDSYPGQLVGYLQV